MATSILHERVIFKQKVGDTDDNSDEGDGNGSMARGPMACHISLQAFSCAITTALLSSSPFGKLPPSLQLDSHIPSSGSSPR